jgi:hypothetical protein
MHSFFIDANGNYFEAIEPVPTPSGATVVPQKPGQFYDWDGLDWVAVAPPPPPVPQSISFAQLLIGLVTEQWITEAEADAWLAGTLPFAILTVIDGLPVEQQFPAKVRALRPSEVLRSDPLVAAMGTAAGKTATEIDAFFQTYAGV